MKKLLILISFLLCFSYVRSEELIRLESYSNQNNMNYASENSYVMQRCLSLYLYVAAVSKNQNPTLSKMYQEQAELMIQVSSILYQTANNFKESQDRALAVVTENIKVIAEVLADQGKKNYALTGMYLNKGNQSDLIYCKGFWEDWNGNLEAKMKVISDHQLKQSFGK